MFDEQNLKSHRAEFHGLLAYLANIPAVETNKSGSAGFGSGRFENGDWWVKFTIDIGHDLAWRLVQELGFALNYPSPHERLPTSFKPVSPPTYLNGGPEDFLSWTIECHDKEFSPSDILEWLSSRMPDPVDDLEAWILE